MLLVGTIVNKTIYIKDQDVALWDRARELSEEKLSAVIMDGLKRFVADKEAVPKGFERIVIRFADAPDHYIPKAKALYGRWIIAPEEPLRARNESENHWDSYAVAVSAKGAAVVFRWSENDAQRWDERLHVFSSMEKAAAHQSCRVRSANCD